MPRINGIFQLVASYLAVPGQTIKTEQHNPPLEDIAQGLTDSLPRDGTAGMTANLPMGGNKITGLGQSTANNDAVRHQDAVRTSGNQTIAGDKTFNGANTFNGASTFNAPIDGPAVTQTPVDTTAGRLMKVGDFGWGVPGGGAAVPPIVADVDDIFLPTGLFRVDNSTAGTLPPGGSTSSFLHYRHVGGWTGQVGFSRGDGTYRGELSHRAYNTNTGWMSWSRIWSELNLNIGGTGNGDVRTNQQNDARFQPASVQLTNIDNLSGAGLLERQSDGSFLRVSLAGQNGVVRGFTTVEPGTVTYTFSADFASQAEAQAATDTAHVMSPARTLDTIRATTGWGLTGNPGSITGLPNGWDTSDLASGVYYYDSGTAGTPPPTISAVGLLEVVRGFNNSCLQRVHSRGAANSLAWERRFFPGDGWTPWVCMSPLGVDQTWQDVLSSRTNNTVYQNTTGRAIMVAVGHEWDNAQTGLEVSANGSSGWLLLAAGGWATTPAVIPAGHYYRWNGDTTIYGWTELR